MKEIIYIRIAKTPRGAYKFKLDKQKNWKPLDDGMTEKYGARKKYFPTTILKVKIEMEDKDIGILKEYGVNLK